MNPLLNVAVFYLNEGLGKYNPSADTLLFVRNLNIFLGSMVFLVMLLWKGRREFWTWETDRRLGWMSLSCLTFTVTYGTVEVTYLSTYFRVYLLTLALIWALAYAVWPKSKTDSETPKG